MAKKKKDRTPAEIVAIRKQREQRRYLRALVLWLIWLVVFTAGYITESAALMWVGFALISADLAVMHGLYERSLRKIANRPVADYDRIHKLQKRELPRRGNLTVVGEEAVDGD